MILWNTEGLKPIGYLVWPLRSLKVRNPFLTLTWPGDLTFGDLGLKFWHKVCNSILSRYWKNGGAARRRFSAIREKPEGRAFFAPPPSSARVKIRNTTHMQPLPPVGVEVGFRVGRSRQFRLESDSKLDPESVGVRSFSWSRNRNR